MPEKPTFDMNDTGNRIIAGIVLALVFLGGWWLIARTASAPTISDENSAKNETKTGSSTATKPGSVLGPIAKDTPTKIASSESIQVEDQKAGMSVVVKGASLVQVGWIAVRDSNGRTLGAGRFEPGMHAEIPVPLLRATEAGQSYQALIYVDDGDKAFDIHKDILITQSDGSVAGDVFLAQ